MPSRKTSITAYNVAASLVKLAEYPRWTKYLPDDMIALNRAFVQYGSDSLSKQLIRRMPAPLFLRIMDQVFIPGFSYHYLFRKLLIEDRLQNVIAENVRQVIVLGGGFDTLSLRMAKKYPGVTFFEFDLPGTQNSKLSILARIRHEIPANCQFIQADLAQTRLETALGSAPNFNASQPTFVILEGVLMYLSEAEVKSLFTDLAQLFKDQLTILFGATVSSDESSGNYGVRVVNRLLKKNQEGTKWFCPSGQMGTFMHELGYRLEETHIYKTLQERYRSTTEIQRVPQEDENYYVVVKE
jgi:methyltransferase (TIGR00027 family)